MKTFAVALLALVVLAAIASTEASCSSARRKLNQWNNRKEDTNDKLQDIKNKIAQEEAKDEPDAEFLAELEFKKEKFNDRLNQNFAPKIDKFRAKVKCECDGKCPTGL